MTGLERAVLQRDRPGNAFTNFPTVVAQSGVPPAITRFQGNFVCRHWRVKAGAPGFIALP